MKKFLLIELLKKIKKDQFILREMKDLFGTSNSNGFEIFLKLTSSELQNLLIITNNKLFISQLYFYINGNKIKNNYETVYSTYTWLLESNSEISYYIVELLENNLIANSKIETLFASIFMTGKEKNLSEITDIIILKRDCKQSTVLFAIQELLNCRSELQKLLSETIKFTNILKHKDCKKILSLISNAENILYAQIACTYLYDDDNLDENLVSEIEYILENGHTTIYELFKSDDVKEIIIGLEEIGVKAPQNTGKTFIIKPIVSEK